MQTLGGSSGFGQQAASRKGICVVFFFSLKSLPIKYLQHSWLFRLPHEGSDERCCIHVLDSGKLRGKFLRRRHNFPEAPTRRKLSKLTWAA